MNKDLNKEHHEEMQTWFGIIYIILTIIAFLLIGFKVSIDPWNMFNWGWLIISLEIIYVFLSLETVGPTDGVVFLLFGNPLYALKSGLIFVPFGISEARKLPSTQQQLQIPAEPELVDKSGDDSKPIPAGMVRPIRVTTNSFTGLSKELQEKLKDTKDDPLQSRVTAEVSMVIYYSIKDFVKFLKNVGSIKEVERRMRDTAEAVMKSEMGKKTPYLIIQDWAILNDTLDARINDLVGINTDGSEKDRAWGIIVISAQLIEADFGKTLNMSLRDAAASVANKTTIIRNSEAEQIRRTNEGVGIAAAERASNDVRLAFLQGQAKVAETLGGQLSMGMDIAGKGIEKGKIVYVLGGPSQLFQNIIGAGEIIKDMIKDDPGKKEADKK